jgi:hypothetical protein
VGSMGLVDRRQIDPSKCGYFENRMIDQILPCNKMPKFCKDKQLLIHTKVQFLNGEEKEIKILVDTGAEANLVKKGLIPEHLFYPAKDPVKFETGSGQSPAGGSKCTIVKLLLRLEKNDNVEPEEVGYNAEFYDAEIKVDAILSYPWLAKAKLGIFPHHHALVLDCPELSFLYGLKDKNKRQTIWGKEPTTNGNISKNLQK